MTAARAKRRSQVSKKGTEHFTRNCIEANGGSCSLAQDFAAEVTHTSRQAAPAHTEMELAFELLPADAVAGDPSKASNEAKFCRHVATTLWRVLVSSEAFACQLALLSSHRVSPAAHLWRCGHMKFEPCKHGNKSCAKQGACSKCL